MIAVLTAVAFIVAIMVSIALHELGHLIPSKLFDVKVTEYFVGFGKTLWSTKKGDTEYGIKAIPLGGYCRLVGMYPHQEALKRPAKSTRWTRLADEARAIEHAEITEADEGRLFYQKPLGQKLLIMAGGVLTNLLLAYLIFIGVNLFHGQYQTQTTIDTVAACISDKPCTETDPPSPAAKAGILPGDRIVSVNGHETPKWEDVKTQIRSSIDVNGNGTVIFVVERQGQQITLPEVALDNGQVGIVPEIRLVKVGPAETTGQVADLVWENTKALVAFPVNTVRVVVDMISGNARDTASPISVVGAGMMAGEVADQSEIPLGDKVATWFSMLASVNLFLGLLNLVPLPPMDGGHVASALIGSFRRWVAKIRKKPDPGPFDTARLLPISWTIGGLLLLMGLILIVADIINPIRLFG